MCKFGNGTKVRDNPENSIITDNLDSVLWSDKCDYIDIEDCVNLNPNCCNLIVMQLNVRSLLSNQSTLNQLLRDLENRKSKVDLILLCETFLTGQPCRPVSLPGYRFISSERANRKGGGKGILVREEIMYKVRADLCPFVEGMIESTFIEIVVKNRKSIVVGSLYKPPDKHPKIFTNSLNETVAQINAEGKELILGMDHNMDLIKSSEHKLIQQFLDDLLNNDIFPTITRPTQVTHATATLIDNIFVSKVLHQDFKSAVLLNDMSDHMPLLAMLKQTKVTDKTNLELKSRNLNDTKIGIIRDELFTVDWIGELNNKSSSENFTKFCSIVKSIMDKVSPERTIIISHKHIYVEPWMTHGIELASRKKLELYKKSISKNGSMVDAEKYRKYRNELNKLKCMAQKDYYAHKVEEFRHKTKDLWKVINNIIGKNKHRGMIISHITINGVKTYSPRVMANEFAQFYSTLGVNLATQINPGCTPLNNYMTHIKRVDASLILKPILQSEVEDIILKLPNKISYGHDRISNILLK